MKGLFARIFTTTTLAAAILSARPPPPRTTVGRIDTPPVIDGRLDDACWETATTFSHFVELDMSAISPVQTTVWLCWTDEELIAAARCEEPNIDGLQALIERRDGTVWRDDCIEFFLDPGRSERGYHQIIANTKGTVFDQKVPGSAAWDAGVRVGTTVGENHWIVELAVPFSDLGGKPALGDVWGFNVGRERYAGAEDSLSAWSATYGKFDQVQHYGEIVFDESPIRLPLSLPPRWSFGPNTLTMQPPTGMTPRVELFRTWPDDVQRSWPVPDPEVIREDGQLKAVVRIVDGSEEAIAIVLEADEATAFRQSLPLHLAPEPRVAELARRVIALRRKLVAGDLPFSDEAESVLQEAQTVMDTFLSQVADRNTPMTAEEWALAAANQTRLARELAGMVYILWPGRTLAPFSRNSLPDSLNPDPVIRMTACGNEREAAVINVTNLGDRTLTGRLTMSDLSLAFSEDAGLETQPNLLSNGTFEQDEEGDGIPDGWRRTALKNASYGLEADRDGNAFALSADDGGQAIFRQNVSLEAGERYTLKVDMSADNLRADSGFCHLINHGWTWSKSLRPRTPTSARMSFTTSFRAPHAEFFQVVLRLVNGSGGTIRYHSVTLVKGAIQSAQLSSTRVLRLHDVSFEDLRVGQTVADPLPLMNGARRIEVPTGESRQVWLSLNTRHLPPGIYTASLSLKPDDRRLPTKSVALDLDLIPVRLPDRMPIAVYNWDYAHNEHYVRDLADHRNNTFLMNTHFPLAFDAEGALRRPVDWSSYDPLLHVKLRYARQQGGIVLFSYGIIRDFHRRFSKTHGWDFMDDTWRRAFRQWVLEFERHVRDDVGMAYDEYAVQLWDEATHDNAKLTVEAGTFMRSFAPRIRTCMDGAQNVAEITAMDPVIDLWIPHQRTLYHHKEAEQIRALYRQLMAKGEPVWTYTCSTNMKSLSPLDYYRLKEWRVWDLGVQGSCYWAYNSWRGDPWNDFDGTIADCGTVYDGPDGPVTSRRWEATLDGREDYLCLHLIRQAAETMGQPEKATAQTTIDNLVEAALDASKNEEAFLSVRSRLLDTLVDAAGTNPPSLEAPPTFERQTDNRVACKLRADRPIEATLYWRVPGEAEWNVSSHPQAKTPELIAGPVPEKRPLEWYVTFADARGGYGAQVRGLQPQGWIMP